MPSMEPPEAWGSEHAAQPVTDYGQMSLYEIPDGQFVIIPGVAHPERTLIKGRRVVIKLTWEPNKTHLTHECLNAELLREANPVGNGAGPDYEVPVPLRPVVEELGLVGVDLACGPYSQDMVFLCGWDTARLVHGAFGGRGATMPDITASLASFLRRFAYIVIPKADARLFTDVWRDPRDREFAGAAIASVLRDTHLANDADPRRFLALHVNAGASLGSWDHVSANFLRLLRADEYPAESARQIDRLLRDHVRQYQTRYERWSAETGDMEEVRYLRNLRIARDERPAEVDG